MTRPSRLRAFDPRVNLRALLCRPATHMAHIDGLRAVSIVVVVVFHMFYVLMATARDSVQSRAVDIHDPLAINWAWKGEFGVDVFFAISGFLIARHLFQQYDRGSLSLRRFYWRRFLRIYPMLVVASVIYVAGSGPEWRELWANLLFVNNLRPWDRMGMEWTWSLAIEEQFYVTFPVFVAIAFPRVRRRFTLLCALFVASIAVRAWVVHDAGLGYPLAVYDHGDWTLVDRYLNRVYIKPHTRASPILAGILIAYVVHAHRERWTAIARDHRRVVTAAYLAVVGVAVYFWVGVPNYSFGAPAPVTVDGQLWLILARPLVGVAAAVTILLGCVECGLVGRLVTRVLGLRLWYPVAQASYSMYLLHVFVIYYYFRGFSERLTIWTFVEAAPIILCVTFAASTICYLIVERPLMNLR